MWKPTIFKFDLMGFWFWTSRAKLIKHRKSSFVKHVLRVMVAQNLGVKNDTIFSLYASENNLQLSECNVFRRKICKDLMDYTVMSLTNPHIIRGRWQEFGSPLLR